MPTPAERKALLFLSLVAILGAGVRAVRAPRGPDTTDAAARRALRAQINAVEAARREGKATAGRTPRSTAARAGTRSTAAGAARTTSRSRGKKTPPTVPVDVDRASAEELETLPGIGPALAARIIADRNLNGPFGSVRELQRVSGVGPALSNRLTPHVTFSGTPRPSSADLGGRSRASGASAAAARTGTGRPAGRMSIPP